MEQGSRRSWLFFALLTVWLGSVIMEQLVDNNETLEIIIEPESDIFTNELKDRYAQNEEALNRVFRRNPEVQRMMRFTNARFININRSQMDVQNNSQCDADLERLVSSLTEKWAFPLIDSFGKIPSGMAKLALFWPGDFDECRSVQAPQTEQFPIAFKGRYCFLRLPLSPIQVQTGICVPNSCSSQDMNEEVSALNKYLSNISFLKPYASLLPNGTVNCLPDEVSISCAAILCICLLALFAFLVTAGTVFDCFESFRKVQYEHFQDDVTAETQVMNDNPSSIESEIEISNHNTNKHLGLEILLCFSVIKNARAILDTKVRTGQLNAVHGIRVISMTWVILGHTYLFGVVVYSNLTDLLDFGNSFSFQAVSSGTFSVDTFFLLSGFLLAYLFLKENSPFTVSKLGFLYLHRYIRLTPVYMVVLFVTGSLFYFLGDGPYWDYTQQVDNPCMHYWWRNLLYINNLFDSSKMCMGWSWYLANDMQFFLLSPVFLVFLKSAKKTRQYIGLVIVFALISACWITSGVLTDVDNIPIIFDITAKNLVKQQDIFDKMYDKPYTRIAPYLIGCLLGYAIIKAQRAQFSLSRKWLVVCWSMATILALAVVYGLYKTEGTLAISITYNSFGRSAWALSVAWVIYACLTGAGGPVNTFLSWKLWFPLSRITYCTYLMHPLVMYYYYQTLRAPIYGTHTIATIHFLGFVVLSYGVGFITSLLVEAPLMKIEKLVKSRSSK